MPFYICYYYDDPISQIVFTSIYTYFYFSPKFFYSPKNDLLIFYVAHFQIKQKNQITNKRLTEECWTPEAWNIAWKQKQHKLSDQDS